jgi:large subunit ribosomal protein L24
MEKWRVKKGDMVVVTTGKDKGKVGEILSVVRSDKKVVVKGVNVVKRHVKPSMVSSGGIVEKELPIHVSNVMHQDPKTKLPTRVGFKILDDGRKVRYSKKSGEVIDV